MMKQAFFKKADIILAVVLLIIAAAGLMAFRAPGNAGSYAVITVDGKELDRVDLSADQSRIIETTYGTNTVTIKDGCAFVSESDCPGQDCVRMDKISGTGQMIVCLPHHLTVVIEGAGEGPDAVIK